MIYSKYQIRVYEAITDSIVALNKLEVNLMHKKNSSFLFSFNTVVISWNFELVLNCPEFTYEPLIAKLWSAINFIFQFKIEKRSNIRENQANLN